MATRVLLTIDTELTWRHYRPGGDWRTNFARSYDPAGVGIPYQLRQLARHGLKACFFVDPMPGLLHGPEVVRAMVEPILAAGQEVQLHVHSFWADLARGRDKPRFELTGLGLDEQCDLIGSGLELLMSAGAPRPIAFRAGSYGADANTLEALRRLGLSYDSSHNGADHPWPSGLPLDPALIVPARLDDVTEVPVTQIRCRGRLRPFQICALSSREMRAALAHAADHCHPIVTIVGHSFELATRDGRRPNRLVRHRFDRLCAFLADRRESMPTMDFANLPPSRSGEAAEPLPERPSRTALRMAEQAWGTARYERPGIGLTVATIPPLAAMEALLGFVIL